MEEKNVAMEADASIQIDRLIYIILRSWRKLLKVCFSMMLLGVVLAVVVDLVGFCSKEYRIKKENEYHMELISHEIEGKNLKRDIQNLYESIQQQENYNEKSLLMQIDPYNKYIGSMTYYVDTGYQIMPEYQYQNIDYGPRLVELYAEYLTGGEMYAEVAEGFSEPYDVRFIEELLSITAQHSMGMFEIQICAESRAMCQSIMDIISTGVNGKYADAMLLIGAHTLTELNKNISSVVDISLDEMQKANLQAVTDATALLTEKRDALEKWEREDVPEAPYSLKSVVVLILKAAGVGALLGVLIMVLSRGVSYIAGDCIVGTPEFRERCVLSVLGELPEEERKKCRLDHWVDCVGRITLHSADREKMVAVAAENICMAAYSAAEHIETVAVIGSIPSEELERVAAELQSGIVNRIRILASGNPLISAESARGVRQSDAVVLVEKQGCSTYTDVLNECERMNLWGKNVLGIIFTNVDAK